MINHEWDDSNPTNELIEAFDEYRSACYGSRPLSVDQLREVRQAFFSGIHWLNCKDSYDPDEYREAIRRLVGVTLR